MEEQALALPPPEIHYPQLSDDQERLIAANVAAINFVSGGMRCGLSYMARVVLRAQGLRERRNTLFLTHDKDSLLRHRQELLRDLEPALSSRPTGTRFSCWQMTPSAILEGHEGAWVSMAHLEEPEITQTERVGLIIIDDASRIPGFRDLWREQLVPLINRWKPRVWVFGRASGTMGGFGRVATEVTAQLAKKPRRAGARIVSVPSEANDHFWGPRQAELADMRQTMPADEWAQECEGKLLDHHVELTSTQLVIGKNETFVEWCERLGDEGLKVDGLPFRLDNRPTMRWIYEQIPSSIEEAFNQTLTIMKCSQVGFTVMEMLATIYLAIKFMPGKVGMFLPGRDLAALKSSERFLPIVRTIPDAHRLMTDDPTGTRKGGEGNVLVRNMGASKFHFLWTSGRTTTESVPLDVVSFDEVQEMTIADMEKTKERLSASRIKYTLMGSTANWPDSDIHFFYKRGQCWQFWTHCEKCDTHQVLDDHFPSCIAMRQHDGENDYHYVCHACDEVIPDSQVGEWRALHPDRKERSIHYPQMLSPTITPREIIEAYHNADSMKNFYNRKLGKPYTDPSQVPVNMENLNAAARRGMELGVQWESRGRGYFMGLDQGGGFNHALVAKRLPSGHMAIVHAEIICDLDPFDRCSELMGQFGISVCVVEQLPNYNDAKRFAQRHPGKVFLTTAYTDMKEGMIRWGDAVPSKQERKTSEEDRDRCTVNLDQYKCMQVAMKRITAGVCVFPDPSGLVQTFKIKGVEKRAEILKDEVFFHFTRTALIAEQDDEEKKFRRKVVKIGIDPHFSYAFMLLNVAWARAHGTTMFLIPEEGAEPATATEAVSKAMPGLPTQVVGMIETRSDTCGACSSFDASIGLCTERRLLVKARDTACELYIPED